MPIPENAEARFYARKPSGHEIYNMAEIVGNTVKVNLTSQTLAETGIVVGEIQIKAEERVVSSFAFPIEVKRSIASETAIESGNEYGVLDGLLNEARNRLEEMNIDWGELREEIEQATKRANEVADQAERGEFTGTIEVGTVETGEPEESVEIKNTGTAKDAILNFKIPRGKQGEKGEKGDSGVTVLSAGMFALMVEEETGDLYAIYSEEVEESNFEYDDETGNLYYIVE